MTVHSFELEEAVLYGTDAAALLYNIRFWLLKNKANHSNIHDGYVWTFNSAQAFSELFPYMSRLKITRHLKSLCDAGVLKSDNHNAAKYDRTLWYTIPAEFSIAENEQSIVQNRPIHCSKMTNAKFKNDQPIPDINTDINNNNSCGGDLEKVFSGSQLSTAQKILAAVLPEHQAAVLDALTTAIKTKTVKSKLSYLRGIVKKYTDGDFTPVEEVAKQLTSAEVIAKEQRKKADSEKRVKESINNFHKTFGIAIPAAVQQQVGV